MRATTTPTFVADEVTLYIHIVPGDGVCPWAYYITRTPDLPLWRDGQVSVSRCEHFHYAHSKWEARRRARRWCRRNAPRLAGRVSTERYVYTATWERDV